MSLPWASMARTVQLYTDLPLRMTVQAPQVARSQTRLAPVSSRSLRSASSSVTRGSRLRVCGLPLILSVMGTAPGPTNLSAAAGAASAFLSSIPALRTPPPMPAPRINPRRETPRLGLPETSESFFELTGHSFHAVERDSQTVRKRIGCDVPPEYTRFFSEWRRGGKNISTRAFLNSRGRDSGRPLPPHRSVRADLRIRLLPWMNGVKANTRIRMRDANAGNPPGAPDGPCAPNRYGYAGSDGVTSAANTR